MIGSYLPFQPLAEFIGGPDCTTRRLAGLFPEPQNTFYRWKREGKVPFYAADRVACKLGVHPSAIWSTYWQDAAKVAS